MIGIITGKVVQLSAPTVCVMTAGGVGYDVELTVPSFCGLSIDNDVLLYTHMVVREDYHGLYGFVDKQDRDAFRKLIKITGVGAKMALAMLSAMSAGELKSCVDTANETALVRIPGVGKKTAQRLLIELKGKLDEFSDGASLSSTNSDNLMSNQMQVLAEVESALIGLGYKDKEAQSAIKNAYTDGMDTQDLLKNSLKQLSGF
ncbi:MAG: Holliday junction branch migration protein RuvA [Moraxella sp.]|nr:Holliday junction branch migration protein RuvA [Moraxella sp.]